MTPVSKASFLALMQARPKCRLRALQETSALKLQAGTGEANSSQENMEEPKRRSL